jgi:hypothetical protein
VADTAEPQNQTLPAWTNALRTAIEFGPKVAITAGAVCYGIGLLIVSSHLATLGVYSTDFLRTEYVLAGATYCVLTLCAAVGSHYLVAFGKDSVDLWKKKKYVGAVFELGSTVALSLYIFTFALNLISTPGFASYANWHMWLALGIAISSYTMLRAVLTVLAKVWSTTPGNENKKARMGHWWHLVLYLVGLFATIGVYTEQIYPHLLLQYGGGHTEAVALIPTANGERVGHLAGLPFQRDGLIGPLQLLLENDQGYTVATMSGGHVASIARDLVEGVVRYDLIIKVTGKGTVTSAPPLPAAKTPAAQPKTH